MVQWGMEKVKAIELLGGTNGAAADAVGISEAAVSKWPDVLPARIADRVVAAVARKSLQSQLKRLGVPALSPKEAA